LCKDFNIKQTDQGAWLEFRDINNTETFDIKEISDTYAIGGDMKQMWNTIVLLVSPNSGVGVGDLAGPIGIFSLVSDARSQGAVSFFIFVAFLSVNIGFLNLLPIPALDGGRIAFIIYEGITKKKVNKNFENILITITFVLLLVLMVVVSFQDILRLFR
jgi:regulator of sigma E protease